MMKDKGEPVAKRGQRGAVFEKETKGGPNHHFTGFKSF